MMTYAGDKNFNYATINGLIRQVAAKMDVPLVDNYAYFMKILYLPDGTRRDDLIPKLFLKTMHPSEEGYRLIANNLYQVLKQQAIIP
jgi:lysophospholipase L1-like esterase